MEGAQVIFYGPEVQEAARDICDFIDRAERRPSPEQLELPFSEVGTHVH